MKSSKELNKLDAKKFSHYINDKCELRELAEYALSEDFRNLRTEYRLEIEHILFECYGKRLPEDEAWKLLKASEFDGRIIGKLPNATYRRAKIDINLFGYDITLAGVVQLPPYKRSSYNTGASIHLKLTDEFGVFDYREADNQ